MYVELMWTILLFMKAESFELATQLSMRRYLGRFRDLLNGGHQQQMIR